MSAKKKRKKSKKKSGTIKSKGGIGEEEGYNQAPCQLGDFWHIGGGKVDIGVMVAYNTLAKLFFKEN